MRTASTSVERRAHLAAARYLMRHFDERVIVVVDEPVSQEPIGVITENNVARALALGHDLNEVRVADISPKASLSVESTVSVRDATTAMLCHGVRCLPVVDQGRLVGIVCLRDLRRHLPRTGPTLTTDAAERVAIVTSSSGGIGHVPAERLAPTASPTFAATLPRSPFPSR
jgi:predicted transcriptional regulator